MTDKRTGMQVAAGACSCLVVALTVLTTGGCEGTPSSTDSVSSEIADVAPATAAHAELPMGPANEYGITPFGRMHRSCVHEVPQDATVSDVGRVTGGDRIVANFEPCQFRREPPIKRSNAIAPTISGWVEDAFAPSFTNQWGFNVFNEMTGTTTVPNGPSSSAGQTIFLFYSLEPSNGVSQSIIQPVIQWGPAMDGGGAYWTASVWYISASGVATYLPATRVNTGDVMAGDVKGDYSRGAWALRFYRNGALFDNLGIGTTEQYTTAQTAVLEAYNLSACNQLPNQSSVTYSNVHVYMPGPTYTSLNDVTTSLGWSQRLFAVTPQCGYSVSLPYGNTSTMTF